MRKISLKELFELKSLESHQIILTFKDAIIFFNLQYYTLILSKLVLNTEGLRFFDYLNCK